MGLKAIFSNKITVKTILFTLFIFIIFRLGINILIPGANVDNITNPSQATGYGAYVLSYIFSTLGGGNLSVLSLFMLGVSPYVSASIIIQLLETDVVPAMSEWKHQGVDGEQKRAMWTRIATVVVGFFQAFAIILLMESRGSVVVDGLSLLNLFEMSIIIVAGVTIMMWLADRITEYGIGNGISVIIMANILAGMPYTLQKIAATLVGNGVNFSDEMSEYIKWGIILVIQLLLIIATIYYNLAERKVHINYVRSSKGKLNEKSFLPIKINPAGVIPVLFVAPFMAIPQLMINIKDTYIYPENADYHGWIEKLVDVFFNYNSNEPTWIIATLVYFAAITGFSILYSYIQMNPKNMVENLEKQGAYAVGVRSGKDTERYFEKVINKTAIVGGAFLGLLAITPILITHIFDVGIRLSLLGTSLIIVISVIIQTYEGLLNKVETKKYRRLFGDDSI